MLAQVSEWLELKVWQLAVSALSALRPLGAARTSGRVLRAASDVAQRATERALDAQAQRALRAEYVEQNLYAEPGWNAQPSMLQRLTDSWVVVAIAGWVLGMLLGLWLAGAL